MTLKSAAAMTRQSQQTFREKVRAGKYPDSVRGFGYDAVAVCMARVDEVLEGRGSSPAVLDLTAERARKERLQADRTEFDLAIARKEYVHISHVERILERFAAQAAATFDAVTSKIKNRLPHLSQRDIDVIKKELAGTRNAVAELRPSADSRATRTA